jgi:large subunit ribosomal protein L7/L12
MAAKIEQLITEISNLTALELAELTKALEEKFGVTAMAPMGGVAVAAPAAAAAGQKEEEKDSFKIELIDAGPDKIKAIKAVRQVKKDLGLTEAKKMVEEVPSVLAESASKDEAKTIKEVMEAAGAKVKLS